METKNDIVQIAQKMMYTGKGILAADESTSTAGKRLASVGLENTEEHRRAYRDLFLGMPGIGNYLNGVILFDETLSHSTSDGRRFVDVLREEGVLPGIKVDEGKHVDPNSPEETLTKGLEGLSGRLEEYADLGLAFAKWRAVIQIGEGLPTEENITVEAEQLAVYAKLCQQAGIVPMVEPEVLHKGAHSLERAEEVTKKTLQIVFEALKKAEVDLTGVILKTSMVLPGSEVDRLAPAQVAEATVRVLKETVPESVAGVVFLSGGQEAVEATENLQAIAKLGPHPWPVSFSYARALQEPALKVWQGKEEQVEAAREVFKKRLHLNCLAVQGMYEGE